MDSTIKFDRVILVKELNEKFCKIGEAYEVTNVLDNNAFLLRDAKTKEVIGIVSLEDFERCFVHDENFKGWTKWQQFNGYYNQNDCVYRTNKKKVQVRFLIDNVRSEASCCKDDDFNLTFGIKLAYLRCLNKVLEKKANEYKEKLATMDVEITDNYKTIQKMINSLTE